MSEGHSELAVAARVMTGLVIYAQLVFSAVKGERILHRLSVRTHELTKGYKSLA